MLNKISRASILLAAFSQHMFGAAGARARAAQSNRHVQSATARKAGSKPAGTRGMHHAEFAMPFRPMAHGKLGKAYPASASKRVHRENQRRNVRWLATLARYAA